MQGFLWTWKNKIPINLLFANVIFRFIIDSVFVDSYDDAINQSLQGMFVWEHSDFSCSLFYLLIRAFFYQVDANLWMNVINYKGSIG